MSSEDKEQLLLELEDHFDRFGWQWSLKGKGKVQPDRYDFLAALDEVARVMYAEPVGTIMEMGRLVIIKTNTGYEVYVMAGTFEGEK